MMNLTKFPWGRKAWLAVFLGLGSGLLHAGGHNRQPAAAPVPDKTSLIWAGTLLAVPGETPLTQQTLIIKGELVESVQAGFVNPEDYESSEGADVPKLIDLSDSFVLPGIMDAHAHLMWSVEDFPPPTAGEPGSEDLTLWTLRNARVTLAAGFTTVRDLASYPESVFAVRDWINGGKFLGPRILAAGLPVGAHGGHGDTTPFDIDPGDSDASGLCSGVESCRRAVRIQKKRGADVIKMMATGGLSDNTGTDQLFFFDEMKAVVDAAHQLGLKVATHAYASDAVADAVKAGVDSIDHGYGADEKTLKEMKKQEIWLVPTLTLINKRETLRELRKQHRAFETALAVGAPIAFGSDTGGDPHSKAAGEFQLMVDLGMSPEAAIRSATVNTAELFGLADEIGTLESGKLADIIAVKGNPLDDISVMMEVDFVMKSGRVAKRDGRVTDFFLGGPAETR